MTRRWARAGRARAGRGRSVARAFVAAVAAAAVVGGAAAPAWAVEETPQQLDGVGVTEHLGDSIDRDLTFTDQRGEPVRLGQYFGDGKPVLLTLNYYRCTALCSLQLNGLVETLRSLDWNPGDQYRIVTVSIDPKETAELARGKRANYLKALEKGDDADWSFLVGEPANIAALAKQVGFGYRYDPRSGEYAHAALTTFLSPEGKIARYLYGISLVPQDVKFALLEAAEGRVGSTLERILLTCFHYDEAAGAYGPYAFGIMRLGAVVTLLVLGIALLVLWRRERRRGGRRGAAAVAEAAGQVGG